MKKLIIKTLREVVDEKNVHLEFPLDESHGDYSSNIAMQMFARLKTQKSELKTTSKKLKLGKYSNARELAEEVVQRLSKDRELAVIVSSIEVAGPGFINFKLNKVVLLKNLNVVIEEGEKYGDSKALKGKKIMVEFAHPNTHKELHIGHMRTLILGESLSRIFEANGAKVFRANYQGDIGPHVAKAIWGTGKLLEKGNLNWKKSEKLSLSEKAHLLGEGYVLGNQKYEENKKEIDLLNTKLYEKDPDIIPIYERTRRWSLEYYDSLYGRFSTEFDRLYFESEVAEKGKKIVEKYVGKVFEKSEGAVVFSGEKHGLHTRVFITKDGNPTYEAKDMYLAPLQYGDFPFDLNIHVVANEQKGYFRVIIKALELVDSKFKGREYHLPMGMVNMVGKKCLQERVKIITVDSLLETIKKMLKPLIGKEIDSQEKEAISEVVTIGAIKHSMLKVNPEAEVLFDVNKSVSLEGNSGPYLQYTFARTQSVLQKAEKSFKGGTLEAAYGKLNLGGGKLNKEEEYILRSFVRYPGIIIDAAKNYSPNIICNYLFDLAQKYNHFYNMYKVIGSKSEDLRLAITAATGQVLHNGLNLLGIKTPKRM